MSIWTVGVRGSFTGNPGELIGTLGSVEINSLSEIPWPPPATIDYVTVEGFVDGLTPGEDYFLIVEHDDQASITEADGWVAAGVDSPSDAEPVAVFWGGRWQRIWTEAHEFGPQHLHARIEGTPPGPELKIDRAVQISWPESENAGVLERASSPEGPWEAVTETVQTVDGENRVTILSASYDAYFRLREE